MSKLQTSESTTPVNLELLHRFALRIQSLSAAMGLDDQDEQLLWDYLAAVDQDRLETDCALIARFLQKQGEGECLLVEHLEYNFTMDSRFDKRTVFKQWLRPLSRRGRLRLNKVINPASPEGKAFLEEVVLNLKFECFAAWYPHLKSIPRENGVDWNPPETSDIKTVARFQVKKLVPQGTTNLAILSEGSTNVITIS